MNTKTFTETISPTRANKAIQIIKQSKSGHPKIWHSKGVLHNAIKNLTQIPK